MMCNKSMSANIFFGCFNTIFFHYSPWRTTVFGVCGFVEVVLGFLLLCDSQRLLLSRLLVAADVDLTDPPLYYLALALIAAGLATCAVAALGYWATYMPGYIILSVYFLAVLSLVACECAGGATVTIWPGCAGFRMEREDAVPTLQAYYAVPDHEPYTAAVDLAQTLLECCGMSEDRDYETSAWRVRRLGPAAARVPLSCCVQHPHNASHLNPAPKDYDRCQEPQPAPLFRHVTSCFSKIEDWYKQQQLLFILALIIATLLKLGVLISTILSCVSYKRKDRHLFTIKSMGNKANENIYQTRMATLYDEPITAKYVQPNNFYSPRLRNPKIFHSRPNEMI